jgi:hypothetical protein
VIVLVAPEPASWIVPLTISLRRHGAVQVFAPWALGRGSPSWLPARSRPSWTRRRLAPGATSLQPGWTGVEAALGLWAGRRTDRLMTARYAKRRLADGMAAWWLEHLRRDVTLVVAPSLAARRTFAAAAARALPRVLLEDLPGLRELHDDLDRASRRWPDSHLLRRYRAPAALVARQEAERVLADLVVVGGRFAERERRGRGLPPERIAILPRADHGVGSAAAGHVLHDRAGPNILLAGSAAARHGVFEALEATRMIPGATLLVRPGEGAETAALQANPQVRLASTEERERLSGVDLVLAPAWCECYPPEVPLAARLALPVVASGRAAGTVDLARAGAEVPPGDVPAIVQAIERLWRTPRLPLADDLSTSTLDAALDSLLAPSSTAAPLRDRRLRVLS